jgi:serine/threonine protein kinase/tetratricopeptide (TPR) repeat protein
VVQHLPQMFGRYVLTQVIGEGGMAEVFLANARVAEGLSKRIVIKKIRKDFVDQHEFTRMFVDEAKIALSLNHANIVQVFDFGQVQGAFYLAMELVEGVDLMRLFHSVSKQGDRFPPVIAAYVAHQVSAALAYAHRKTDDHGQPFGIVHRDISPHNVMVSYEGQVKILDFGIARTARRRFEQWRHSETRWNDGHTEETIKGKVAYMSPEQAQGRSVDGRSDVYSLGVVMHELLTGQLLFRTKDRLAALERVRTEPIPPLLEAVPDVPPPLAAIVDRALRRDLPERYESARALQADLAAFLHRADPVVDDEVLSQFVARYHARASSPAHEQEVFTSESDAPGGTPYPPHTRAHQRVVIVHVALDPRPLMPGDPQVDPQPFLTLARDVAFKRDAQVLSADADAVVLAFGTLFETPDDADRALRAALALQEDVGEMAPGLRVGIVVTKAPATVARAAEGEVEVEVRAGVRELLHGIARAHMEGPVMASTNIVDDLCKTWRFGHGSAVAPSVSETLSGIDRELEHVSPVIGPALASDRREAVMPGGRSLLFGRELELKMLRDTFSEAIRARESRAVLVLGEPGIGKRALVERFVSSLPRTACWVFRASGSYARRNVPLGVFLDMLSRFLGIDHRTEQPQIVAKLEAHGIKEPHRLGEALSGALGVPGATGDDLDPFSRRDRLWKLVRRLTTTLAQRRPVLIVLENLHLHDEQSILLLKEWVQVRHPWPILGLTTGRHGQRTELVRAEPNVACIELHELDQKSRRELVVRRFEESESTEELADAILARAGGNPLFIEQILAALLDRGVITWNAQGRALVVRQRGAPIELPPSVEAVLADRIEQLPRTDREVLQGAAILGRHFRPAELSDLLGRSVGKSLDTLVERHFLERLAPTSPLSESVRFATVSLHEVCKAGVAPDVAKVSHARAAELIRGRPDYAPERDDGPIADHLMQADRPAEAVEPAMSAAMRAYDLAGNVEAYYHLSQALRAMTSDDPRRWEALLRRERILRAWGRRRSQGADVRALLVFADRVSDPVKQAIASIRLLRFYLEVGRVGQAERLVPRIEDRIVVLPSPAPFLAVLGELRSALMFIPGDFESAELKYCAADARGQRQRCRLLRSIGQVKNSVGHYTAARQYYDEALEIARRIGNQRLEANLLNALGEVAGRSTRYQEAIDHFKAALAIDRDLGDRYATGRKLANLGMTYACIGLMGRAERFLRKALELHEAVGHPGEFNDVAVHLGEVVALTGDVDSARTLLLDAARVAANRGDIRTELRARIRLAAALLRDHTSRPFGGEAPSPEDREAARVTAEQVLSTARAHGLRTSRCRALHVLALLAVDDGRVDAAVEYLREGVELVRAGAAPLDGVRSIHLLGKLLRNRGDESEGASLLDEAARIVLSRIEDLRDEDLRRGYLEQHDAREILQDGGVDPMRLKLS